MKLYLVIRASMVFGIFSSKKHMKEAIEAYIDDHYKTEYRPCPVHPVSTPTENITSCIEWSFLISYTFLMFQKV